MSNAQPGDLARKAKKTERAEAAVSLDTMLGQPQAVELRGRTLNVYPVTLGRLRVFGAAQARLGELGYFALVIDNERMLESFNRELQKERPDAVKDMESIRTGLNAALLSAGEDTVEAMVDIAEVVLNGDGQTVTREDLERWFLPCDFVTIFRTAVNISGINP